MAWLRRVLVALGTWGIASLGCSAVPASAATPLEILTLRLQPCPAYEVSGSRSRSDAEVATAKSGTFDIRGGPPVELVPPVDWTQDPYHNRSWIHYLHNFTWLDQLLYAYVADGDTAALVQARDLLLDWIAANPQPAGPPAENWKDKTVGDRAAYLGFVARAAACEGALTDAQASTLIDSMRAHGVWLVDSDLYEANNHGLYVDLGLARLGGYAGFLPEGAGWVGLARERFQSTLQGRLEEEEGVWLEHSTAYQFAVINLVTSFGRIHDTDVLAGELARMKEAAGWFVTPAGEEVPYGDSGAGTAVDWAQEKAADDEGLRLMPRSGLAVVKHAGGYLLVTAGFHSRTHKHADDLGFHLHDRGRDVITDSGFPGYNFDKWRRYAQSATAHSVLSVGRREFPIDDDRQIYGSGISAGGEGGGWYAIEGRNPLVRPQKVRHRRLFLYRPGRALVVIDLVGAKKDHVYHRRFQLAPGIEPKRRRGRLALRAAGFRGGLRTSGELSRLGIVDGQYNPPGGWSWGHGQRVARSTVDYRSHADDADLVAALGLRGAVSAKVLSSRRRSFLVGVSGGAIHRTLLRVSRRGQRLVVKRTRWRRGR